MQGQGSIAGPMSVICLITTIVGGKSRCRVQFSRSRTKETCMGTSISTPQMGQPSGPSDVAPKKRVLWKWSLAVTLVLMTILLWRCGTGLMQGRELSANGVLQFHALLNSGQNEQIYDRASDA